MSSNGPRPDFLCLSWTAAMDRESSSPTTEVHTSVRTRSAIPIGPARQQRTQIRGASISLTRLIQPRTSLGLRHTGFTQLGLGSTAAPLRRLPVENLAPLHVLRSTARGL